MDLKHTLITLTSHKLCNKPRHMVLDISQL